MLLFLGSGVSVPSGLPSVDAITGSLLDDRWFHHAAEWKTRTGSDLGPGTSVAGSQCLLRRLASLDSGYLKTIAPYESQGGYKHTGSIYRQVTTYEDLFYLVSQISDSCVGLLADAPTAALIDLLSGETTDYLEGDTKDARVHSLGRLAAGAFRLIESLVANSLATDHVVGLDLISELANADWVETLDIVTLNHDTLVERVLADAGVTWVDGFGGADGEARWLDRTTFDSPRSKVTLIKPHGSVDWYSFLFEGKQRPAIVTGADPLKCRGADGQILQNYVKTPSFLSGSNKVTSYNRGIYAEMFYRFHEALKRNTRMVMSGYGWGDLPINFRLEGWLDEDPARKLLMLYEDFDALEGRSLQLATGRRHWTSSGRMISHEKWLCDTSVDDVKALLGA